MRRLCLAILMSSASACSSAPAAQPEAPTSTGLISETTTSPDALEHFHKGQTLFYNLRTADASAEFDEALRLDPEFLLARVFRAQATLGDRGVREVEEAAKAADRLPEAERLFIQSIAAGTRGDVAESEQMLRKLTDAAKNDWRSHYALGFQYLVAQKYGDAIPALRRATDMNADAAVAQNMLGYALLRQGDTAGAITAFQEYVRVLPQEPNPQDSLGEALMAGGRFQESAAAFNTALTLSPQFWNAYEGLAYAKIYAGDWAGGRQALEQARMGAPTPASKIGVSYEMAAAAAAQGRSMEALQILNAGRQTPGAEPGVLALIPVYRAQVLIISRQPRPALGELAPALVTANHPATPAAVARPLRTQALRARITAEGELGDANAAMATAALLQQDASARPDDPTARAAAQYADGIVAMTGRDFASAQTALAKCAAEDDWCQWQAIVAAERAADKTAAANGRDRLLRLYRRDPVYLMVRSRVTQAATRSTE